MGSADWNYKWGEQGLKLAKSLPVLGVWIEIPDRVRRCEFAARIEKHYCVDNCRCNARHSLYLECGLKRSYDDVWQERHRVIPYLGVWIETRWDRRSSRWWSRSIIGAWIETGSGKWVIWKLIVAPFIGSVDWNLKMICARNGRQVTSFIGSVDWNFPSQLLINSQEGNRKSLPVLGVWIETINGVNKG